MWRLSGRRSTERQSLRAIPLPDERLWIALPSAHPLASRKRLRLGQLRNEPFILYPRANGSLLYDSIIAACQQCGIQPACRPGGAADGVDGESRRRRRRGHARSRIRPSIAARRASATSRSVATAPCCDSLAGRTARHNRLPASTISCATPRSSSGRGTCRSTEARGARCSVGAGNDSRPFPFAR